MLWLDHVTSFVNDRHASAAALRDHGVHAVEGGLHTGFGSANDLSHFGLFYLELLEITDPIEAASSGSEVCRYAVDFLEGGEGLATLALETDDLDGDVARLRDSGYTVAEPILMQRVHDDGFVSHSRIAYPSGGDLPFRPPIVIERSIGPEERAPQLAARGTIAPHRLGRAEVGYVAVAVPDAHRAAAEFARDYGVRSDPELTPAPHLGGTSCTAHLGRADLRFVQPEGAGPASERLDSRGPGPFAVGLILEETLDPRWAAIAESGSLHAAGISFVIEKAEVRA